MVSSTVIVGGTTTGAGAAVGEGKPGDAVGTINPGGEAKGTDVGEMVGDGLVVGTINCAGVVGAARSCGGTVDTIDCAGTGGCTVSLRKVSHHKIIRIRTRNRRIISIVR